MSHRDDNYKEGVPSVTELLKWVGYYFGYEHAPNDPTGYYLKRGNFIEQCGTILLQGQELDERSLELAEQARPIPSGGTEHWATYLYPFADWVARHKIKFVGAQIYVYNPWETYQGTLDWLLEIDGALTVVDCKTGTCPKFVALQTAGYAMAYKTWVGETTTTIARLGLQLEPGQCTEHPYNNFKDYDAFRILARCYHMHGHTSKEYR